MDQSKKTRDELESGTLNIEDYKEKLYNIRSQDKLKVQKIQLVLSQTDKLKHQDKYKSLVKQISKVEERL